MEGRRTPAVTSRNDKRAAAKGGETPGAEAQIDYCPTKHELRPWADLRGPGTRCLSFFSGLFPSSGASVRSPSSHEKLTSARHCLHWGALRAVTQASRRNLGQALTRRLLAQNGKRRYETDAGGVGQRRSRHPPAVFAMGRLWFIARVFWVLLARRSPTPS